MSTASFPHSVHPHLLDLAYTGGLLAASPILLYRLGTSPRYRQGLQQRLGHVPARHRRKPCLWIHAASAGEVHAAQPLAQACLNTWPDLEIVLSTQTSTGQELAEKTMPHCLRFYFPIDFSGILRRVFDRIRPSCIALVEREIWPNFVTTANRRGIPVVQVNSRLSEKSLRAYRWLYPVMGPALQGIDAYVTQSEAYAERLARLAIPQNRIHVAGNLKYDSIAMDVPEKEQERLRRELGLERGQPILVGGSVHPGEERALLKAHRRVRESRAVRLVLAPRHFEKIPEIERSLRQQGEESIRKSEIQNTPQLAAEARDRILIVDTMGELRALYSLATAAFVGGTLVPVGGHNLLEPAALGIPVVTGPFVHAQQADADALSGAGGAAICANFETVAKRLIGLFNDPSISAAMGERAKAVLINNQGSAQRTIRILRQFLSAAKDLP